MCLHPAIRWALTCYLLVTAMHVSGANSEADRVMRRFMLPCDSAGNGKPEAVYACALTNLVQAGDVSADIVQACRDDLGPSPVAKPQEQVWQCTKVRQFGSRMDNSEWHGEVFTDCGNRSRRAGHRYERRHYDCVTDAIIEQRRVSDADIQRCRATPGIEKSHRLLNCLHKAMQPGPQALPSTAAQTQVAGGHSRAQCDAYAKQRALARDTAVFGPWFRNCLTSSEPMEQIEQRLRDEAAARAANLAATITGNVQSTTMRGQDDAQYSVSRVQNNVREGCANENRASLLQLDCDCMVREADRHMAESQLPRRSIAQREFDVSPCIDRRAMADKYVASTYTPEMVNFQISLGVSANIVEATKACMHRAIAEGMPRKSLNSYENLRSEGTRCSTASFRQ